MQNVWKCTVFSHLRLKFAKSAGSNWEWEHQGNSISLSNNLAAYILPLLLVPFLLFFNPCFDSTHISKPFPTVYFYSFSSDPPPQWLCLFSSPSLCTLVHRIPSSRHSSSSSLLQNVHPLPPPPLREGEGVGEGWASLESKRTVVKKPRQREAGSEDGLYMLY